MIDRRVSKVVINVLWKTLLINLFILDDSFIFETKTYKHGMQYSRPGPSTAVIRLDSSWKRFRCNYTDLLV